VGLQVEEKQEAADTLVAVGKRVILDHEIEQMSSASLYRWISDSPSPEITDLRGLLALRRRLKKEDPYPLIPVKLFNYLWTS